MAYIVIGINAYAAPENVKERIKTCQLGDFSSFGFGFGRNSKSLIRSCNSGLKSRECGICKKLTS